MMSKKDGGWRMCVDYRRLNSVTKFDWVPLPHLDEALDTFAGATVVFSLDIAMAYHHVPVKPADVEKIAFITHVGLFEMAKMPFGLCNAPSTYQRLMISVLQGLIGRICLAYLDDVIVFSKRRADHVNDLRAVLERIRDGGLKLKPAKCNLFCDQVLYLGHVISAASVSPDPAKLRVLADWPLPTTVRELQSFLGFVNFYGDFFDEQTTLTASLYDMTAARKCTEQEHFSAEDVERLTTRSNATCAQRPGSRIRTSRRPSRCTLTPRKSLSAQCSFSVTQGELNAQFPSFRRNSYPRRGTTSPSSASVSRLSARSNNSESTCWRARSGCELIITRCSGSSARSRRHRLVSPAGSPR